MSSGNQTTQSRLWRLDCVGAVSLAALTALAYVCYVQPLLHKREVFAFLTNEVAARNRDMGKLKDAARSVQRQLEAAQQELEAKRLILDPPTRLNERLDKIAALASECHLQVDNLEPGKALPAGRCRTVEIRLTGQGLYANCARFLGRLDRDFPDSSVTRLQLSASPSASQTPVNFGMDLIWHTAPGDPVAKK